MDIIELNGLDGCSDQRVKIWLSGEIQRVVINGTKSSWWPVQSGIPQVQQCSIPVIWIRELSESSVYDTRVDGSVDLLEGWKALQWDLGMASSCSRRCLD